MKAIEVIKKALNFADQSVMQLLEDMRDESRSLRPVLTESK